MSLPSTDIAHLSPGGLSLNEFGGMPMTEPETIDELRELVALGCRILGANGHDDFIWGHVSARDPEGGACG